ncbi:hypothetical protein [Pseudaminobacter soli (ex Li et al. 2025)]|uniref:hypothetical protein n=1 Tax=Pseudaminobacter soli (ex Li et al. 2025) TaxID=1295366 RepID=UPI0011B25AC2|nr:hypothetical protein [Mesorhizobium soli]
MTEFLSRPDAQADLKKLWTWVNDVRRQPGSPFLWDPQPLVLQPNDTICRITAECDQASLVKTLHKRPAFFALRASKLNDYRVWQRDRPGRIVILRGRPRADLSGIAVRMYDIVNAVCFDRPVAGVHLGEVPMLRRICEVDDNDQLALAIQRWIVVYLFRKFLSKPLDFIDDRGPDGKPLDELLVVDPLKTLQLGVRWQ